MPFITCRFLHKAVSILWVPLHFLWFSGQTSLWFESSLSRPWAWKGLLEPHFMSHILSFGNVLSWRRGTTFQSLENRREITHHSSSWRQAVSNTSPMGGLPLAFMSKLGLLASKVCFWSWKLVPSQHYSITCFFLPIKPCSRLILML